jgi:hypothetical protein
MTQASAINGSAAAQSMPPPQTFPQGLGMPVAQAVRTVLSMKVPMYLSMALLIASIALGFSAYFWLPAAILMAFTLVLVAEKLLAAIMAPADAPGTFMATRHAHGWSVAVWHWFTGSLLGRLVQATFVAVLLGISLAMGAATIDVKFFALTSVGDWYLKESQRIDRQVGLQIAQLDLASSSLNAWVEDAQAKGVMEQTKGGSCATRSTTLGKPGVISIFREEDAKVAQSLLNDVNAQLTEMKKLAKITTQPMATVTANFAGIQAGVGHYNALIDSAAKVAQGSGFADNILATLKNRADTRISGPASAPDSGPMCGDQARLSLIGRAEQAMAQLHTTAPLDRLVIPIQLDDPVRVVGQSLKRVYTLMFMGISGGHVGSLSDDPLTQQQLDQVGLIGDRTLPIVIACVLEIMLVVTVMMWLRQLKKGAQPIHQPGAFSQRLLAALGRQKAGAAAANGAPNSLEPWSVVAFKAVQNFLFVNLPDQPGNAAGMAHPSFSNTAANSSQGPITLGATLATIACYLGPRGAFPKEVETWAKDLKEAIYIWANATYVIVPHAPNQRAHHMRCAHLARQGLLTPMHAACRFQKLHTQLQFLVRNHHSLTASTPVNDLRWAVYKANHALYAQELRLAAMT